MDSPGNSSEKQGKNRSFDILVKDQLVLTMLDDQLTRERPLGAKMLGDGVDEVYDQNLESPKLGKRASITDEEDLLGLKLYYEALRKAKYPQVSTNRFNIGKSGFKCLFDKKGFENEGQVRGLLELSSEDEMVEYKKVAYRNVLELGFSSKQVKQHSDLLSTGKLPLMSFHFYDIDYNRALKDNERQLRSQKVQGKKNADNVSVDTRVVKPKKGEVPLVFTPRMTEFDNHHRVAAKDNAFIYLSDVSVSTVQDGSAGYEHSWQAVGDMLLLARKYFSRGDTEANAKKIALLCSKERKKTLVKYKKLSVDYVLRAKKFIKDTQAFFKRKAKEVQDLKRKKDKFEVEMKKKEEEVREQERQKRKIEFLIKQSSIYAEIMANKLGLTAPNVHGQSLIELSKEEEKRAEDNVDRILLNGKAKCDEYEQLKGSNRKNSSANYDFSQVEIENSSSLVDVPKSFHGTLKSYQLKGLRWLDSLFLQGINGILADEMGLGKTIQALALLAHLSSNKDNWGPYLVIAPAITLFNWHSEIQRFCPDIKVLPYWGSLKERKVLRRYFQQKSLGRRESNFHIIITSYQIAVSDEKILHRLRWQYIILDEAQAIKNMNSLRWNTLLSIQSRNKLLLTGTPIQNTMAELWALLHFIMPQLFDSHEQFQEWFSKNIEVEDKQKLNQIQLNRLHAILKPFMLRRVKKDVEKEIGKKFEHEVFCELTRRQKELYKKIKSRISIENLFQIRENKEKVKNLMNLVMQFRKVCNHPELFERQMVRTSILFSDEVFMPSPLIFSSFYKMNVIYYNDASNPLNFNIPKTLADFHKDTQSPRSKKLILDCALDYKVALWLSSLEFSLYYNPTEQNLLGFLSAQHYLSSRGRSSSALLVDTTKCAPDPALYENPVFAFCSKIFMERLIAQPIKMITHIKTEKTSLELWKKSPFKQYKSIFPSFESLINDSTKLKYLDKLLKELKAKGLRALIFCQMTKMLDILEDFLQYKRHKYFRLDGSCLISDRRDMVSEFQKNSEVFIFLLSTRAGGLGVTLTAADVVIFYDNDWNPTMDAQAADRAHRIGRTEDVHVYNLITKDTIEERIVKRAKQKKDVQQTLYSGDAFKANIFKPQEVFTLLFDEAEVKQKKDVVIKTSLKNAEEGKKRAKEQPKALTMEEEFENVINELTLNGDIELSKY